jgi:hypothetical protein
VIGVHQLHRIVTVVVGQIYLKAMNHHNTRMNFVLEEVCCVDYVITLLLTLLPLLDEYMTDDIYYPSPYDNYSQPQQPYASMQDSFASQIPSEIKLRDVILQDHNGQQLEHRRIADIKLKLVQSFFGLEYNDSFVGKAVSQFFPSDIITVVRQCDRIGIFIQFRRFLTCRKFNESVYVGGDQSDDSEHTYFKDSPFVQCMYMVCIDYTFSI